MGGHIILQNPNRNFCFVPSSITKGHSIIALFPVPLVRRNILEQFSNMCYLISYQGISWPIDMILFNRHGSIFIIVSILSSPVVRIT